jgi:hypothetical protein
MRTIAPSEGRDSMPDEADFNPLHMNSVLVDDTKGNPRVQMRWAVGG